MQRSFRELIADEKAGRRPSLVFSPMMVEDARRLIVSNLDLHDLTEAYCARLMPDDIGEETRLLSLSAVELRRLFPSAKDMKVGTAARMNASFPFVSPGVSLPTDPPRRVVDAGYYDNFGINLAVMWMVRHQKALEKYTSGVVLVEIRAYRNGYARRHFQDAVDEYLRPEGPTGQDQPVNVDTLTPAQKQMAKPSGRSEKISHEPRMNAKSLPRPDRPPPSASLAFILTPPEGLVHNWDRGTVYRDDEFLDLAAALLNDPRKPPLLTTVALECGVDAALNWHLPRYEADAIRHSFYTDDARTQVNERVAQQVKKLKEWFGEGGGPEPRRLPTGKR
jgi:hypothetical protein